MAAISRNQCACKQREEFSLRQPIRLGIRITTGQRSEMDFHSRFLASVGLSTLHRLLCSWAHISQTIECSTVRGPWIQVARKGLKPGLRSKPGTEGILPSLAPPILPSTRQLNCHRARSLAERPVEMRRRRRVWSEKYTQSRLDHCCQPKAAGRFSRPSAPRMFGIPRCDTV